MKEATAKYSSSLARQLLRQYEFFERMGNRSTIFSIKELVLRLKGVTILNKTILVLFRTSVSDITKKLIHKDAMNGAELSTTLFVNKG